MKGKRQSSGRNKGTFIVKVEDYQRGSWQGKVTWADEEITEYFRSALELMQLVEEALNASQISDKHYGSA